MDDPSRQPDIASARPIPAPPRGTLVENMGSSCEAVPAANRPPCAEPVTASPGFSLVESAPANPLVVQQRWTAALLDMTLAAAAFAAVLLLLNTAIGLWFVTGKDDVPQPWAMVAERVILAVATAGVVTALARRRGQSLASLGIRADRLWLAILCGLIAYLTLMAYVVGVTQTAYAFWPGATKAFRELERTLTGRLPRMDIAQMILFSSTVAISEEVLFRGLLLTRLRGLIGSWWAAIAIISAVFAVLHIPQGAVAVAVISGLSLLLSAWMVWRRNLIVPIIAHALFDLTSLVILNDASGNPIDRVKVLQ